MPYLTYFIFIQVLKLEILYLFQNNGRLLNIIRDPMKGTIWCFTEKLIFKYAISDEDRNIWSIFLEKGDFIKAQEYSKHDPEKLQVSAMYYAMTKASFEEIALKFVDIEDSHALKTFLMKVCIVLMHLNCY
jgi:hypothetical protein